MYRLLGMNRGHGMFYHPFLHYAWNEAKMRSLEKKTFLALSPVMAPRKILMHQECEADKARKTETVSNDEILSQAQNDTNVTFLTKTSTPEVHLPELVEVKIEHLEKEASKTSFCKPLTKEDQAATKLETSTDCGIGTRPMSQTIRKNYEPNQESMFEHSFVRYTWNVMKLNNLERKTLSLAPSLVKVPHEIQHQERETDDEVKKVDIIDECAMVTQNINDSASLLPESQRESPFNHSLPASGLKYDDGELKLIDSKKELPTSATSSKIMALYDIQYKTCETDQEDIKSEVNCSNEMSTRVVESPVIRKMYKPNRGPMFEYSFLHYAWNGAQIKSLKKKTMSDLLPVVTEPPILMHREHEADEPEKSEITDNNEKLSLTKNNANVTFMITKTSSPEVQQPELVEVKFEHRKEASPSSLCRPSDEEDHQAMTNPETCSDCGMGGPTMLQRNFEPNRGSMFEYSFLQYAWSSRKSNNWPTRREPSLSPIDKGPPEILDQKCNADTEDKKSEIIDNCLTAIPNYNDSLSPNDSQEESQFNNLLHASGLRGNDEVKLEHLKKEPPASATSFKACEIDGKLETSCGSEPSSPVRRADDGLQATRTNYKPARGSMFEYSFFRFAWNGAKSTNSERKALSASPPITAPCKILYQEPSSDHETLLASLPPELPLLPEAQPLFDDWLFALGLEDDNVVKFEDLKREADLSELPLRAGEVKEATKTVTKASFSTQDIIQLNFGPNRGSMFEYSFLQFAWNTGAMVIDSKKRVGEKISLSITEGNKHEQAFESSEETNFRNSDTLDLSIVGARKLFLQRMREDKEIISAREASSFYLTRESMVAGGNDESVSMFDYSYLRYSWFSVNLKTLCPRSPQEVLQSLNQLREINEDRNGASLSTQGNDGITLLDIPLPNDRSSSPDSK
jgi:hypothetical protein